MDGKVSRHIPAEVRRQLRQEAYFGCAKCGSPILEYHHIVQFSEQPHHDPNEMIALCPTCHRSLGKMRRERCYALKENPCNKLAGKVRGELGSDADTTSFMVGSNTFIDTPVIFSYYETPIIQYSLDDGQALLDIYIPKEDMWPDILVEKNDLMVNSGDKWDVDFRTNFLRVQKVRGSSYFQLDLRKEVAEIEGQCSILGQEFRFNPTSTNLGTALISGGRFIRCGSGISVGDRRHKLHWPNYGMAHPRAIFMPYG
ncbi:HNH endonuclease [Roseivivax halotolerans]|uniref:HNH endonuclease n=1 Tax=Roseivivax halotolerans TaxID=93684 RepID=A0A1I5XG86_9RHOB|nr:HNH endonuclease signature motif containing protein [Roseivivax halotolerans]SFQ30968.1 HNH endonuclease [Roseivivax halotolerans]